MVEVNNGYRYLFTAIDVFTKKACVYPLKANTCQNVMDTFKDILENVEQSLNVSIQIENLKNLRNILEKRKYIIIYLLI